MHLLLVKGGDGCYCLPCENLDGQGREHWYTRVIEVFPMVDIVYCVGRQRAMGLESVRMYSVW